jgi:aminopeptidase N
VNKQECLAEYANDIRNNLSEIMMILQDKEDFKEQVETLQEQNKQYKKALKDILISDECFKGDILKRMHAMQDVARQALQSK